MTPTAIVDLVQRWFAAAKLGLGPVLPDGWFGRPFDNLFSLRGVELTGDVLRVHLSGDVLLEFEHLQRVHVDDSQLVFEDFRACAIRWTDGGRTQDRERTYASGSVRFHPPADTRIAL